MPPKTSKDTKEKKNKKNDYDSKAPSHSASSGKQSKKGTSEEETENDRAAMEEEHRGECIRRAAHLKRCINMEVQCRDEFARRTQEETIVFWDIEKKALETKTNLLRQKQTQLQTLSDKHEEALDKIKERLKHELYDKTERILRTKSDRRRTDLEALRHNHGQQKQQQQQRHDNDENENEKEDDNDDNNNNNNNGHVDWTMIDDDIHEYASKLNEAEMEHETLQRQMKREHAKSVSELRREYGEKISSLATLSEQRMERLWYELDEAKKKNVEALEERKDVENRNAIRRHEQELNEMRAYFNDMIHNNLDYINDLTNERRSRRTKRRQDDALLDELTRKHRDVQEPLAAATADIERLRADKDSAIETRSALDDARVEIRNLEDRLKDMAWRHEVLYQRFQSLECERNKYKDEVHAAAHNREQKDHLRKLLSNS